MLKYLEIVYVFVFLSSYLCFEFSLKSCQFSKRKRKKKSSIQLFNCHIEKAIFRSKIMEIQSIAVEQQFRRSNLSNPVILLSVVLFIFCSAIVIFLSLQYTKSCTTKNTNHFFNFSVELKNSGVNFTNWSGLKNISVTQKREPTLTTTTDRNIWNPI